MLDGPAECGRKADACRTLAKLSDTEERKALWIERAEYWEELALKAVERLLKSVKPSREATSKPP